MEIKSVSSFVDNPSGRVYIFEKESANFCFRCATFLHEKIILSPIIRKLNFAIPLLRYSAILQNKFSVKG